MKKLLLSTMMLAFVAMTGLAKDVVWEQPTIEYGTTNGDGFFNLALDVTKVELKGVTGTPVSTFSRKNFEIKENVIIFAS